MKKTSKLFSLFIALPLLMGIITSAFGHPINEAQSLHVAKRWLEISQKPMGRSIGAIDNSRTYFNAAGESQFRVVNLKPGGFIILAVDDALEPVIAFSHDGTFDGKAGNPLFDLVSKHTEGMTHHLSVQSAATRSEIQIQAKSKWQKLTTPLTMTSASTNLSPVGTGLNLVSDVRVAPLIQSQWNQTSINNGSTDIAVYNYYTPPYGNGNRNNYWSGCMATAWAQIMRFHQWPVTGVGTGSFSITVDGSAQSKSLQGGDGVGGPYDWANMVLVPGKSITVKQCQAIGSLMSDLGVANSMDYETVGSAAALDPLLATNVFHYASAIFGPAFPSPQGVLALRTNLDAGLPVLFSIFGTGGGHAVVCDGYGYHLATLYHHINMGWGGVSDLWYNLPNITSDFASVNSIYNIDPKIQGLILSGRVTSLDGIPLAGITVTITGETVHSTTTNSNGIFAFKGLAGNSTWTVVPQGGGRLFAPAQTVVTMGSSSDSFNLVGNKIADFQAGPPSQVGFLQMNIAPVNATDAGAQWQVDGGSWHNSGELVSGLLSGSHTVAFKSATGWLMPGTMIEMVNVNQLTTGVGTYLASPNVSTLSGLITGTMSRINSALLKDFLVKQLGFAIV